TGAAVAVGEVLPQLKGKLDGISLRLPTPTVSIVDLAVLVNKTTTAEAVHAAFTAAAEGPLKGALAVGTAPLVSTDYLSNPHSSIHHPSHPTSALVAAPCATVMDGAFVKVLAWCDKEWGYSGRCVDLIRYLATKGL